VAVRIQVERLLLNERSSGTIDWCGIPFTFTPTSPVAVVSLVVTR
jgi:hypothetical protein